MRRREAPGDGPDRRPAEGAPARPRAPRRASTRRKCSSAARAASSPCDRVTIHRASASFACIGSPSGTGCSATSVHHSSSWESGIRIVRPNISSGARRERDVVPDRRAHLLAVPREQKRSRQHDLRLEPVRLHHLAAGEQVVELVGAAELDVGLDRHRVVRLHERIEQLRDRDRLAGAVALVEVVALEHAGDGDDATEADDVGVAQLREPLAVVPHLEQLGIVAQDRLRLLEIDAARSRRSPRRRGSGARSSGRTGRRSASCSRRR